MEKIPILAIAGPTASGKTALSIALAKEYDAEIISCDSMQVYKGMDIGTAKPDMAERDGIVHHMIDIIEPDVPFSVAEYTELAHKVAKDIHDRKKLPLLVGGTGLYMDSFLNDVDFLENDSDPDIRRELEEAAEEKGIDFLVNMLKEFDPEAAQRIHKNNQRRIIRAIEFYKMTGIPITKHQEETKKKISRYSPLIIAIRHDMEKLYERIDKRVDIMIESGLLEEVKALMDKGYTKAMLSMQGIGYKEIIDHYQNNCTLDEAIENIKLGTRHYAKRQMTWFKRNQNIHWIDFEDGGALFEKAKEIIKNNM